MPAPRRYLTYLRARVVSARLSALGLIGAVVALAAALLHAPAGIGAGLLLSGLGSASLAATTAVRILWVLQLGRWTGWKGESIERAVQPRRFWSWTALHALSFIVPAAAAFWMAWIGLRLLTGGLGR